MLYAIFFKFGVWSPLVGAHVHSNFGINWRKFMKVLMHKNRNLLLLLRPGKVHSLFPISHFPDFEAGGRSSVFIIDYVIQPGAVHAWFS